MRECLPHIKQNTLLTFDAKMAIIDSSPDVQSSSVFVIDIDNFLSRSRELFGERNVALKDKYFDNLLRLCAVQFALCMEQYQGVCNVVHFDMQQRYALQSTESIPESSFSTNEKWHERRAPNVSETAPSIRCE